MPTAGLGMRPIGHIDKSKSFDLQHVSHMCKLWIFTEAHPDPVDEIPRLGDGRHRDVRWGSGPRVHRFNPGAVVLCPPLRMVGAGLANWDS
jgi:hypothetical protein